MSGYLDPSLGRFFIGGTGEGMKLGIETPETDATGTAVMDVSVPRGARVWIKTANADVEVNAVAGTVDVFTVSGHTRVAGSPSVVTAESLDGNIELAVESPSARARTGSGVIVFRGVISEASASSVSGPLFIGMEGKISRARFETVSGEIAFKGDSGSGWHTRGGKPQWEHRVAPPGEAGCHLLPRRAMPANSAPSSRASLQRRPRENGASPSARGRRP